MEDIIPSILNELRDAHVKLDSLRSKIKDAEISISLEHDLWLVYLLVEKSIAILKFSFSIEDPGKFINLKMVEDERKLINIAYASLSNGIELIESGSTEKAIESLRNSRNYLRLLIKRLRKRRLKLIR